MQTPLTTVPVVSRDGFITDPFFIAARETLEKCLLHLSQKHQELLTSVTSGLWCCNCPYHAVERLGNWAPAVFIPCIVCYPTQEQSLNPHMVPLPYPMEQLRHVIQDPALSTPPAQLSFTSNYFELLLDMHNFLPHEIRVNIKDDLVEVGAEHEEPDGQQHNSLFISKRYQLPCPVNNDLVQCSLSKDGILFLTAPWKNLQP